MRGTQAERVLMEVEQATDEIVDFAAELVRVPTVNPPGEAYEACAQLLGDRLRACGFEVRDLVPEDRPEHTSRYPRVNVFGRRGGGPVVAPAVRRPVRSFI